MKAISVDNLTRDYGTFRAVDHISFDVEPGEFFGFLGPNGAGKTTTIRMLTGLSEPTEGTALIMGYDIARDTYHAKEHFGVVPEVSNIYEDLSAWNNLMFAGELYGLSYTKRTARAREILDIFDLAEFRDKKVHGFSKGMRRKLTLGMALIHEPDILFLDEPTSGLDVESSLLLKENLSRMNREGTTIFLTTHTLEEANTLCNRIAIIVKGRIAAVDAPENLKKTIQTTQSVEVSLDSMTPRVTEDLAAIKTVTSSRHEGNKLRLFTPYPGDVATAVFAYAGEHHLKILSINTVGPSLEDAFLSIVQKQRNHRTGEMP
jgi:ABC-2 type transport system ATP-binding protein